MAEEEEEAVARQAQMSARQALLGVEVALLGVEEVQQQRHRPRGMTWWFRLHGPPEP